MGKDGKDITGRIFCNRLSNEIDGYLSDKTPPDSEREKRTDFLQNNGYPIQYIDMANVIIKDVYLGNYKVDLKNFYKVSEIEERINRIESRVEPPPRYTRYDSGANHIFQMSFVEEIFQKIIETESTALKKFLSGFLKLGSDFHGTLGDIMSFFSMDCKKQFQDAIYIHDKDFSIAVKGSEIIRLAELRGGFVVKPSKEDAEKMYYLLNEALLYNVALFSPYLYNIGNNYIFGRDSCYDNGKENQLLSKYIKLKIEETKKKNDKFLILLDAVESDELYSHFKKLENYFIKDSEDFVKFMFEENFNKNKLEELVKEEPIGSFALILSLPVYDSIVHQFSRQEKEFEYNEIVDFYLQNGLILRSCAPNEYE